MNSTTDKIRPLRIGLLFPTTGTTSIVEEGQLQARLLAIDEINKRGKLCFKALIEDIKSNPQVAAEKADKVLRKDQADLLVGCWTSVCRKAVLSVLDETGALLLYPTNYEGQESHPQVFYLGAVPNQRIESTLSWGGRQSGQPLHPARLRLCLSSLGQSAGPSMGGTDRSGDDRAGKIFSAWVF